MEVYPVTPRMPCPSELAMNPVRTNPNGCRDDPPPVETSNGGTGCNGVYFFPLANRYSWGMVKLPPE